MKVTGLSYGGVHELLYMVSRACAPQMQTVCVTQQRAALPPLGSGQLPPVLS